MHPTRRRFLCAAAMLGLAAGCSTPAPSAPAGSAPVPVDGPDPLLDWIAAHPENASVLVDDGRGAAITHLADRPRPVASAGKVVHLVAYARAVVAGRLDPRAPVTVAEWERWYLPATDGLAHPRAVQALGVAPDGSVSWDDLAAVMIDHSDNAVPDLIRETLGDPALVDAAAAGGWTGPDLPSFGGESLLAPGPVAGDRRAAAVAALRAYAADPAQRAAWAERTADLVAAGTAAGSEPAGPPSSAAPSTSAAPDPATEALRVWFDGAPAGTATQLAGIHRAAATDRLGPEVSAIVRGHLERGLAGRLPSGVTAAGQKGGSLPGLISHAFTVRRDDGTVGSSVVLLSGMPTPPYQEALASGAVLRLAQQALLDDGVRDRLAAAVGAR